MNVLGIETSCDETAAAVVSDGRRVLSSVVSSQVALHKPYGGVVPEIASRNHVVVLPDVIEQALAQAGVSWDGVDAVAATYGPGLSSSLVVGLSAAKALALRLGKPLIGINHLEAHLFSVFLGESAPRPEEVCPFVALIVSGGHTCLVRAETLGSYRLLGQTVDDAAGEAFDKGANLLKLGYPGGPAIDKAARNGNPSFVRFPRGLPSRAGAGALPEGQALNFSFSGLKTALLYYLRDNPAATAGPPGLANIAASYQEAIVDSLVDKCRLAARDTRTLVAGGGVVLNSRLRHKLGEMAAAAGVRLMLAEGRYCGDNAAMIAGLAGMGAGIRGDAAMDLKASPNLMIGL